GTRHGISGVGGCAPVGRVIRIGPMIRGGPRVTGAVRPFVGGNLGTPLCDAVDADCDVAVVEVSSYQLELPGTFRPRVGAILNLAPDHLARHGDLQNYAATKCRIFEQCDSDDWAILPLDEPLLTAHLQGLSSRRLMLLGSPGIRVDGTCLRLEGTPDDGAVSLEQWALPGHHNLTNAAAAVLLAVCAGARTQSLDLGSLRALPHRMQVVHSSHGVDWINDSKATNLHAAKAALEGLQGPLVVLLGGQGKEGADYGSLRPLLAERARTIICFGHAGPRIAHDLEGLPILQVSTLRDAADLARHAATPGDTVLLSPACASFDAYDNFEHRGEAFTALAREESP
ncbi:MAG: UDP-N-acetylmuramoyl-L-alanine--D-glutamate ligase, partial [Myxococcota bacterium]|nr:UDP-N-acetylmuramoyl-L-alanine--D-glutamate ligase [Myxococcota bacterium]